MKQLREKAGLRTIDVAYHLDVAESTVRNWEYGRTMPRLRADQFAQLCQLYKCSIEELAKASQNSQAEASGTGNR
ncbi:MAG: helix-turn-helix transcriptional regulator [Crocosphaera sp.]